jgi:hypothetical protein
MASSPAPINVPRVYASYEEAVAEMGFSKDFQTYTLCEVMYNYFVLFNTGPIILVNVLTEHERQTPIVDGAAAMAMAGSLVGSRM